MLVKNITIRYFLKSFSPIQYPALEYTTIKWEREREIMPAIKHTQSFTWFSLITKVIPFYGSYIWGAINFILKLGLNVDGATLTGIHKVTEIERAWESFQGDSKTSGSSHWLIIQSGWCVNHPLCTSCFSGHLNGLKRGISGPE